MLQGLCRKASADDDADDDKDNDDDGDDMLLLLYSLKVVGAQRGSVLNLLSPSFFDVTIHNRTCNIHSRNPIRSHY